MRHGNALAAAVAVLMIALWAAFIYFAVFEPAERGIALLAEEYGLDAEQVAAERRFNLAISVGYWLTGVLVTVTAFGAAYVRARAGRRGS